jgi:Uma2 family endonuclease
MLQKEKEEGREERIERNGGLEECPAPGKYHERKGAT